MVSVQLHVLGALTEHTAFGTHFKGGWLEPTVGVDPVEKSHLVDLFDLPVHANHTEIFRPQSECTRNAANNALEFHLSGLTGTASHPDMQKIWLIRFFFSK
jgi:hypothetical protein